MGKVSTRKVAVVTGGTGGIGTSICRRLVDDGYSVVACYFSGGHHEKAQAWQTQQSADGYQIEIRYGDVCDWDSVAQMIRDINESIGPVDILVNNAGITRDSSLRKMSVDSWRSVLETNLFSVFNVTRQVVDGMVQRGFGRIVTISSINAEKGQFGQTNYAAAKSGMYGFSKSLALEVASKGVTVNTISPGYVETEMIMRLTPEIRDQIKSEIPVGRFGKPSEIARMVSFIVADEAGYITGANFSVNGGQHM